MRSLKPRPGTSVGVGLVMFALAGCATGQPASSGSQPSQPGAQPGAQPAAQPPLDWAKEESGLLKNYVQLTKREQFVKAGEQYFNSDASWIIFQAVPVPEAGKEPATAYLMYVAKVDRDSGGHVTGLSQITKLSADGSANTCGWFDPVDPTRVIYGSTIDPPAPTNKPGYQGPTGRYMWSFPHEMEIVTQIPLPLWREVMAKRGEKKDEALCGNLFLPSPLFRIDGYDAECSFSRDAKWMIYTHVEEIPGENGAPARPDADLWVYKMATSEHRRIVQAPGYDGGPFISPDGTKICYRSDRKGNNELQLFIADLEFDSDGVPTATKNERQLTDANVNWAPYWDPSGTFLIFASSQFGHQNYEAVAIEANTKKPMSELRTRRITTATGADVLPVFSNDGKLMMWTSQRGPKIAGEERPSSQIWCAEWIGGKNANELFGSKK
ncbi:MAG: hypothetical protein U0638_03470 [Phycisphaerales bacterium]